MIRITSTYLLLALAGLGSVYCRPSGHQEGTYQYTSEVEGSSQAPSIDYNTYLHPGQRFARFVETYDQDREAISHTSTYEYSTEGTSAGAARTGKVKAAHKLMNKFWSKKVNLENGALFAQASRQAGEVEFGPASLKWFGQCLSDIRRLVMDNAAQHIDHKTHSRSRALELHNAYGNQLTALAFLSEDQELQEAALEHLLEMEQGLTPSVKYLEKSYEY